MASLIVGEVTTLCASVLSPDPRNLVSTGPLAILDRMNSAENNHETTRPGGITGNGFKPGQSGNPGGRPKGIARAFRDAMGSPEEAARGLLEIAQTAKRPADRIAAWRELLDRGWGKAPAFAAIQTEDPLELDDIAREIQVIADELRARREAREQPNVSV